MPPKYVVFIIMDSLRADRVRAFNPKARPETPNWEKLAETSTRVHEQLRAGQRVAGLARVDVDVELPREAQGDRDEGHLADKWMTIDEVAKKAGKYVAGASGNGYIRPERGFGTAWDQFVNHIEKGLGLKGADIMEKGLSFITPKKDQPWFLYLGFIDTHVTWRAKRRGWRSTTAATRAGSRPSSATTARTARNGKDLTEQREGARPRALRLERQLPGRPARPARREAQELGHLRIRR